MPSPPTNVSGGCLCGAVRYEINFAGSSSSSAWPPETHTCQCTQCRKRSGALVVHWIDITTDSVLWSSPSSSSSSSSSNNNNNATANEEQDQKNKNNKTTHSPTDLDPFTEFSATPGKYRGFCNICGSPLSWRSDESPGEIEVATGSLDEEFLVGEGGEVLAGANAGHFWCERRVRGVTDLQGGRRWRWGGTDEEMG